MEAAQTNLIYLYFLFLFVSHVKLPRMEAAEANVIPQRR
jgi:hypothetical protein